MKLKMKSGQVLILVLLVVVVALAVGLSVASRNIINLRTSTQTEQSQRAFSAAEGGIENVLPKLDSVAAGGGTIAVPVGNINANVEVKKSSVYERPVALGDVAQINLGAQANGKVQIEWAKPGENAQDSQPASIEVTQIYGSSPYNQERFYFQGGPGRSESGTFNSVSCNPSGYQKCAQVNLQSSPQILRIKPFWTNTTIKVSGGNIPTQTYDITSTASTEIGVTRKVQVTRTALPQLPAVFDYVLYSEGDIVK